MCNCYCQRLIASIQKILFLTKLRLFSCSAHCFFISRLQLLIFIISHYKTSLVICSLWMYILTVNLIGSFCYTIWCLQTKKLSNISHYCIKVCLIFLICCHIIRVKLCIRNFLIANICKEGIVISSCKSNSKTTCLMITCNKNQRLIWMLVIKLNCLSYCFVHCYCIGDSCCRIICMTCPVNFSTFYHHKKSSIIIKHFDSLFNII